MTELVEYKDKIIDAVDNNEFTTALNLIHEALKTYLTSKKDREELAEVLDYALQVFTKEKPELAPEILKDIAFLALLQGDIPTGKILYEKIKQYNNENPDFNAELIIQLWENKINQKDAIFSLQGITEITILGIPLVHNEVPIILGGDIREIERYIRLGYEKGHYILSIMEDKTSVLQDVEMYHGSPEDVEVFQEVYHGEIDYEE